MSSVSSHGFWGLNSGPHACKASNIETEVFPNPLSNNLYESPSKGRRHSSSNGFWQGWWYIWVNVFNYNLAFRLWSRKINTWECKNWTFSYFQTLYRCYSYAFWFWRNDIIFWKYIIIEWLGLLYSCLTSILFLLPWMLGDLSRQAVRYDPVPTL